MCLRKFRFVLLLIIVGLVALPAAAHGYVVRSIPENRATLERPPPRLQYWFSEALEPQFSSIKLRDQNGTILAEGAVDAADRTLLRLAVPSDLAEGAYIVELRPAFASDGHVVGESRVFFVGEEVRGVQSQAASNSALPLEVLWKALLYHASYVLFGAYVLYAYVYVPVWGSTRHPQGLLPPRLMRRLSGIIWIAIVLVVIGNSIALLQQSMVFFGTGAGQVLSGGLWQVVRIGSRFGDVWNVRLFFLLLIALAQAASHYYGHKYPKTVRSFWTANVWLAALLIGTQAVNSHAAGAIILPWVAVLVHWLHTLAVACWVGGIAVLTLTLPTALQPYAGEARWQALRPVMQRFSRFAAGALLLVISTGIYSATNWFFSPAELTTTYGSALAYKLLMLGALLFVAALHHVALRPQLLQMMPLQVLFNWAGRFKTSLRLETLLVISSLSLAALLSSTPVPEPQFLQESVETPSAAQQVAHYEVQVALLPGGPGINTVDTVLRRDGVPLENLQVALQFVNPQRDERSPWLEAEPIDSGLYVTASAAIDREGRWLTLIDIIDSSGEFTRAVFEWQISADATVIQSVPPSLLNWLALAGVLGAVGFVLHPGLLWLVRQMQWSLANVVLALGTIVVSAGLLLGSIQFIQVQLASTERQLNPPPQIVNPILPDSDSLRRGKALFNEQCAAMQNADAFPDLRQRLPILRDEDLYQALESGWRAVPACENELTDSQRWDVVNYLRTLREK